MSMLIPKIFWHIKAETKKLLYRIIFFDSSFYIGEHTTFRDGVHIYLEKGAKLSIGANCFFNNGCSISSLNKITIGDGSIFGENVKIYDHNHRFQDANIDIKNQGYSIGEVVIGNHCWIGSNVTILKGTNIGDNCVIGAGLVIKDEIPDNTIIKLKNYDIEEVRVRQ